VWPCEVDALDYVASERATIEALLAYEQHPGSETRLRAARWAHVSLRVGHHDYRAAVELLEVYVEDYDDLSAVWAAERLLDALTVLWLDPRPEPVDLIWAHERLAYWSRRLSQLGLWHAEEAAALRRAALAIRAMTLASSCRVDDRPSCADEWLELARTPEYDDAAGALWNAAALFDDQGDSNRARELRRELIERFPDHELADRQH
jgi:hypothetical protein